MGRLLIDPADVLAKEGHTKIRGGRLSRGDAAILRFLAAAEIIESDLWQQYNELAGIQDREVPGGSGNDAYTEAVAVLDEDMDQYIHDNTDDELSHVAFINAYLKAHGERTVNLDKFRTLPSDARLLTPSRTEQPSLFAGTEGIRWAIKHPELASGGGLHVQPFEDAGGLLLQRQLVEVGAVGGRAPRRRGGAPRP